MIDEQLNAIRVRRAALPFVPWLSSVRSRFTNAWVICNKDGRVFEVRNNDFVLPSDQLAAVAAFVTHAPSDIDALLSEVGRLRKALEHYASPNNWGEAEIYTTARRLWEANENGYDRARKTLEEGE